MAAIPGWKIVVVGDKKTPANWSHPNCVFLSLAEQGTLGFQLSKRLPVHSYSRKNLGYLFAVRQGAKVIFDTDDDNRPLDDFKSFIYSPTTTGLVVDSLNRTVFNPYPHFGQATLWPRGYPLTAINDLRSQGNYRLTSNLETPVIQQGVVSGDPDLDAIFRLTRKGVTSTFNVTFDPVAPAAIFPAGTYSPFNSQNTLFRHRAFWALYLPTTTSFRVCDIWRGYWAQRLLWELGDSLGFPAVNGRQWRNPHSYLDDARDETQMYFHTERLLQFLSSWTCPEGVSFFGCVERLSWAMVSEDFWGKEDAENIQVWLGDLLRAGYTEPERVVSNCSLDNGQSFNNTTRSRFLFFPVEHPTPSLSVPKRDGFFPLTSSVHHVIRVCPKVSITPTHATSISKTAYFFQDVLLIIIFHYPYYRNLRYTEAAYRPAFPNIAYCGPQIEVFKKHSEDIGRNLTFIEADLDRGRLGYVCLLKAMQAAFRVTGYLVIGDDILLNFWSFGDGFNKSSIWIPSGRVFPLNITQPNGSIKWYWWKSKYGKSALTSATYELSKTDPPSGIVSLQELRQNMYQSTGNEDTILHAEIDIYYVPSRFAPDVIWYFSVFLKHRLFLEIAVPVVLYGLQPRSTIVNITGNILWNEDRHQPWTFFNPQHQFLHPMKFVTGKNQKQFCSKYIPLAL
ncbi:hypothetical protein EGW08_005374, partial [Elysia chlorotica]